MTMKRMTKSYISAFRTNISILEIRLTIIDETRNHIVEEIKNNDLMSEKLKKDM